MRRAAGREGVGVHRALSQRVGPDELGVRAELRLQLDPLEPLAALAEFIRAFIGPTVLLSYTHSTPHEFVHYLRGRRVGVRSST